MQGSLTTTDWIIMHNEQHHLADQKVVLTNINIKDRDVENGAEFVIEDWWDRVYGQSWMFAQGNPAAINYAIRSGLSNLPLDDEVVYGKIGGLGYLVHVSEF